MATGYSRVGTHFAIRCSRVSLWSVGVIAFMLLSSKMPFYGTKRREVVDKILKGAYEFKGRKWKSITDQAKAFVDDLLVMDPSERATTEEALMAAWLHRRHAATAREPRASEFQHIKHCIERYVTYPRLRKLALMVIAHQTTTEDSSILRKIFQHYDKDHTGNLNYEAFKLALNDAGYSDDDYRGLFDAVDVDGSGLIRYTEFLAATIEATGWISEERLASAFDRVDHDDSGYISKENLQYLLGSTFPEDEIDSIIKEASSDEQRGISYQDFLSQWNDNKEEYVSRWRRHMVPDVVGGVEDDEGDDVIGSLTKQDTVASEITLEGYDEAKSNFEHSKAVSERKKMEISVMV